MSAPHDRALLRALVAEASHDLLAWSALSDYADESGLTDWLRGLCQTAQERRSAGRLLYRFDPALRGEVNASNAPFEAARVMLDLVQLSIWK